MVLVSNDGGSAQVEFVVGGEDGSSGGVLASSFLYLREGVVNAVDKVPQRGLLLPNLKDYRL